MLDRNMVEQESARRREVLSRAAPTSFGERPRRAERPRRIERPRRLRAWVAALAGLFL